MTGPDALFPLGDLLALGLAQNPDREAITDGLTTLSFRQLDDLAWRIADRLRAAGTAPGDKVAVIAAKSALTPAVALAIWKCGAVYVPLDQDAPTARLDALIERIAPAHVVALESAYAADGYPLLRPADIQALLDSPAAPAQTTRRVPGGTVERWPTFMAPRFGFSPHHRLTGDD